MSLTRRLAAAVVPPEDDGGEPLPERGWRATVVGVHVISAVVWTLAVVSAAVGGAVDDDRRTPALAVLAALAVAYAVLGVPAIGAGARRRAVASASVSGLEGLRGRVEQVGGEVDVASLPGAGTRVTVRVPGA